MSSSRLHRPLLAALLGTAAALSAAAGCASRDPKPQLDKQVYGIIDRKWQPDLGTKANYRISDVAPGPNDIHIEKEIPASGVLTLPRAVAIATAHNRLYQDQKEALYLKALDLRLARHQFENQYFATGDAGYSADWNDEVVGSQAGIGFNRLLGTGLTISTRVGAAWVDVLTGNLNSGLASVFSAAVVQPLLRGRDALVAQENLTQAERDTLYQIRSFNRFRKSFVVSVVSEYYRLLALNDKVANAAANHRALSRLYDDARKLADAGRIALFELKRIDQERLLAEDIHRQAQKQYNDALDLFKVTLGLVPDVEFRLDGRELQALKAATGRMPDFSADEAIQTALTQRLDLLNAADAVIDAQRKVRVAADGLRGELNLVGNVNASSSRKADRARLKPLRDEYGIAVEAHLPLDRVAEQNIYRKALITLSRRHRQYELAADTVTLEVRAAYRALAEAAERYATQVEALELAQKRFAETSLLLKYGRASTRRVLRAQQDLFEAENALTDALVDYAIANLEFYRDTGVLAVRHDGSWTVEPTDGAARLVP